MLISSSLCWFCEDCLYLGIFLTYFCPRPSACKNVFINSINPGTFSSLFDFNQSEVKEVEGLTASLQQSTTLVELSQPSAAWLLFRQHSMRIEVSVKTLQLTARSVVDKRCQNLEDKFTPVFSRWCRLNWPYILKIRLTDWKGYNQRVCRRTIPDLTHSAAARVPFQFIFLPSCLFFAVKMKGAAWTTRWWAKKKKESPAFDSTWSFCHKVLTNWNRNGHKDATIYLTTDFYHVTFSELKCFSCCYDYCLLRLADVGKIRIEK